jgi:hypothetical protein
LVCTSTIAPQRPRSVRGASSLIHIHMTTWEKEVLSARGADGRQLRLGPMQIQREVGRNPMESSGKGGRAAPWPP